MKIKNPFKTSKKESIFTQKRSLFSKTEFLDYNTYKNHVDFLDDIYYKQHMMKREMAKI